MTDSTFLTTSLPVDLIAIGALFVVLVFFSMKSGRRFTVAFLASLYIAYTIVAMVPSLGTFFLRFGIALSASAKPFVFVASVILSTWLLSASVLTSAFRLGSGIWSWWRVMIGSALGAGLCGVLFLTLLPKSAFEESSLVAQWLLGDPFPFLWALAPVVFFALVSTRED